MQSSIVQQENASQEVTSNELTDEITDYTGDFETEFEEAYLVQMSFRDPQDQDVELNSSNRCILEELKKLQLGNLFV